MKSVKVISMCLVSIFILTMNVAANDLEKGLDSVFSTCLEYDDVAHTITSHQAKIAFSEVAEIMEIKIVLENVTAIISKGAGESFSVRGISNTTGKIIKMTPREYKVFSQLMATIDFSRWDHLCDNFLYSAINLLQSWPPTLPVLIISRDGKLIYRDSRNDIIITEDGENYAPHLVCPEGKELESVPESKEDLCGKKREFADGHYLVFGEYDGKTLTQEAWTEGFTKYIDDYAICNGRCGIGCTKDMSDRITYTQRCFNHDECVGQFGYFETSCNCMFTYCAKDYLYGPICYELWVTGR